MMRDLSFARLRADYASGLHPADLLDAISTDALNPVWIAKVPRAALQDRARTLYAARNASQTLPLYGIPFAVKDNIDVAGMPTTAACPEFAYIPTRSAHVVSRLEDAGAILVGKTNMDQFATGLVGTRSPYGACSSVFSPLHISGGSSAGSAVAVASGQVAFALGTDTAGSGRVPAAFNNIVGLKPTRGLISAAGIMPACRTLDCVSVFAGTVADAVAVLSSGEGFDAADAFSRPAAPPALLPDHGWRFGVPAGIWPDEGEALHRTAIARLEALGGTAVLFDFEPFARAGALLYSGPFVAERLAALRARGFNNWAAMDPIVASIISHAATIDAADAFAGQYALADAARTAAALWQNFDVILLPTVPFHPSHAEVAADPQGVNARLGSFTNFVNLLDLCACAIPAGLHATGLPYGVSLIAPGFADAALARLAARLHAAWSDATVGSTAHPIGDALPPATPSPQIRLAVVGAHLTGQPLHHQLTTRAALHERTTRTAPGYRLYALAGTVPEKPGLVRDHTGAGLIEVEIFRLDPAAFGSFVAEVPPPLAIGTVELEDGSSVKGFVCEPAALVGATDITSHGGWRAWRRLASPLRARPLRASPCA